MGTERPTITIKGCYDEYSLMIRNAEINKVKTKGSNVIIDAYRIKTTIVLDHKEDAIKLKSQIQEAIKNPTMCNVTFETDYLPF